MKRLVKWIATLVLVALVGLVALLWTPDTDPQAMRTKYAGAPSQFVDLGGGLTVHLRDEGPRDAPVIVLLHGSNADLHTWDPWVARLKDRYRIIRYDQIGHGLTGPSPTRDYKVDAFVADVERVTQKLGVRRFILAGNSMGGGITWRYAVAHPDRLTGLILIDASGAPQDPNRKLPIGFRIAQTPVLRNAMLRLTPRSVIDQSVHQSVINQAIVTPAMVDRYWEMLRYPGNRQATIDRATTPPPPVDEAALRAIAVPTLILWGDRDTLLPVSGARWFARLIPNAKTVIYPGIGHLPMEEVAEQSAKDVIAWLESLPTKR